MTVRSLTVLILVAAAVMPTRSSTQRPGGEPTADDEFFIISSVDLARGQLLLKRPTEVTEVMRVDRVTRYLGESAKPIALTDLRAGDTVYIRSKPGTGGAVAIEIRQGPMTLAELHRRYLQPRK